MIHVYEERTGGKLVGFDGIFESVQTRRVGRHSKNTWFIDGHNINDLKGLFIFNHKFRIFMKWSSFKDNFENSIKFVVKSGFPENKI